MTALPKLDLILERAEAPITERVTKFGGQPVWLEDPAWPLAPASGEPMEFVAQVRLEPAVFANQQETMAYLFVADAVWSEDTWDPYSGESAVVIQPGDNPLVATVLRREGPTLHHVFNERGAPAQAPPEFCEFGVVAVPGADPAAVDEVTLLRWEADPWLEYQEKTAGALGTPRGIKVGGEPYFFGDWPEAFAPDVWRLLLQLDGPLPFFLNLGTDGIGYVLVRNDLRAGVFFWERPG
jgi:hypothetical protein